MRTTLIYARATVDHKWPVIILHTTLIYNTYTNGCVYTAHNINTQMLYVKCLCVLYCAQH